MDTRRTTVDEPDGALLRAKALAAPTRVEIMSLLRKAPSPLAAAALAEQLGIHHTAVRQHLERLSAAGLVVAVPLPIIGRGRPRTGYSAINNDEGAPYRELAGMLAEAVRTGDGAREAGRAFGRRVAESPEGPLETLRAETERMGFLPTLQRRGRRFQLTLTECPFADLAVVDPATICSLHLGLAEGIAERDGTLEVEGIRLADPRNGGCRIAVRSLPM